MIDSAETTERLNQLNKDAAEAEEALLCACVLGSDVAAEAVVLLDSEDFYRPKHKKVFKAVRQLVESGEDVNQLSLAEALAQNGDLEAIGGRAAIIELCSNMLALSGWREQINAIKRANASRKLAFAAAKLTGLALDAPKDPADIADLASGIVDEAFATSGTTCVTALEAYNASKRSELHNIIPCGFVELDEAGFTRRGALTVVGGASGVGKTSFCVEAAFLAAAGFGTKVAIVSFEDDLAGIGNRLANTVPAEGEDAVGMLADLPLNIIAADGLTPQQIYARLNRIKRASGLDLVFIDCLQYISSPTDNGAESQAWRSQVDIAHQLRLMARKLEISLVVTSQLSRSAQKRGAQAEITDLRDSGSIEQDASVVAILDVGNIMRICKNNYASCQTVQL